jgi:hypothetical protein
MKQLLSLVLLLAVATLGDTAAAAVSPEAGGGYRVTYNINLGAGTSNGSDIQDVLIFAWNGSGDFSVESASNITGQGNTVLTHLIAFRPTSALIMGWGAGVTGVGDEKDHLFTVVNPSAASAFTGKKWSEAFPGIPPTPRTSHSGMVTLLQSAAATGDATALSEFVRREAAHAAFDPAGQFRVLEWTDATPIPPTYSLAVSKSGTGSGTVTSSGIDCGSDCSEDYEEGTVVELIAMPATGSTFIGWGGDADCEDGSVTMDADKSCTATFDSVVPPPLTPEPVPATSLWGLVFLSSVLGLLGAFFGRKR